MIVYSVLDIAGINIAQQILKHYAFTASPKLYKTSPLYTADVNGHPTVLVALKEEAVCAQYLQDDFPDADLIVFISRHTSQSGKPTLTVHTPGNFGAAEFGGYPKIVSVAPAVAMQTALKALDHYRRHLSLSGYQVSYECTHHGPSLNVPAMFVELGSSPAQWSDSRAAEAVAHSALTAVGTFTNTGVSAVLGIGGTHYNEKFTTMALMDTALFGHMIPKYAVSAIDSSMIRQCVERTFENVPLALLDWKGISSKDKPSLLSALEQASLPYQKI
ncbi:MAG: D-aminoacyl-tRNA deacylase [Nitrososphaerota archaeon]|uniref:D-aminoacyl-tRNA deacylase n=1 Tax=Candidatus Bathycorpusculum sp. TaxID=2994959 RepID=UPI00282EEF84|nr:D-aminoacyl-tRNA deacylase [Candidatus Termitimicrobium sp.]MDR0492875.1 D-aminoacyl-tRNA deacylase [Nitrososphaerota archaeon]